MTGNPQQPQKPAILRVSQQAGHDIEPALPSENGHAAGPHIIVRILVILRNRHFSDWCAQEWGQQP